MAAKSESVAPAPAAGAGLGSLGCLDELLEDLTQALSPKAHGKDGIDIKQGLAEDIVMQ